MPHTKDLILQNAIDLFSERGYANVSMREIAAAVGIQAGSIYNHYESKNDILEAILGLLRTGAFRTLLVLHQESTHEYARTHTLEELLHYIYTPIPHSDVEWVRKVLRILTVEQFTVPQAREFWETLAGPRATENMKNLLDTMVEAGHLPNVNTLIVAEASTRIGVSYVVQFIQGEEERDSDTRLSMRTLIDSMYHCIKRGPFLPVSA